MSKKYYINVWECLFYKVDEQGNELRDDNGNIILYEAPKLDYSSNTEFIEDDDELELPNDNIDLSQYYTQMEPDPRQNPYNNLRFV